MNISNSPDLNNTVYVLGVPYHVMVSDPRGDREMEPLFGITSKKNCDIKIASDVNVVIRPKVLFHEMMHVAMGDIDQEINDDEQRFTRIFNVVYAVLKENGFLNTDRIQGLVRDLTDDDLDKKDQPSSQDI